MHRFLEQIEADVHSRPSPIEFKMACQARAVIDRLKFAIKYTEQFAPRTETVREARLRLLDHHTNAWNQWIADSTDDRGRGKPQGHRSGSESSLAPTERTLLLSQRAALETPRVGEFYIADSKSWNRRSDRQRFVEQLRVPAEWSDCGVGAMLTRNVQS
jgi:hypothetical protein